MITFFRRIRKNLISENRASRYLLYALGEILLVVIGILIALSVNNWNEERIKASKEKSYLKEIRTSLEKDTVAQNRVFRFNDGKTKLLYEMFVEMGKNKTKTEHMTYLFGTLNSIPPQEGNLGHYDVFEQNRAAFDNMVAAENISLVRNDSLRFKLSEYYRGNIVETGTQERVKQVVRKFTDLLAPLAINRESLQLMMNLETSYPSIEEMEAINKPELMGQLFLMLKTVESQTVFLQEFREDSMQLISGIDAYLEQ